jgi:cellobiose epimerase
MYNNQYQHISRWALRFCLMSLIFLFSCQAKQKSINGQKFDETRLASEMEKYLKGNLLQVYYPSIIDYEMGGFFSTFSFDWKPVPPQQKCIVTQARDVWTACKAAERYPNDPRYRKAAEHGYPYLRDHMWDHKNGGFYFYLDQPVGQPEMITRYKKAYGHAFGIFALAAYAKLTGSEEALLLAQKAFQWFEEHSHDAVYGGYYDWMTLEGISYADPRYHRKLFPAAVLNVEWKDYNSSIHILEAFSELYTVWPDPLLRQRLEEMLIIIRDKITTEKGYMKLYFRSDWTAISYRDSSKEVLQKNINYDHVSFGHDIETAFLLLEASHALGLEKDVQTQTKAKKMIDHTIAHGFDGKYAGIVDVGYYFDEKGSITILKDTKEWWCQAEGLNALLLFSKLYPEDTRYREVFRNLWDYVKLYFIDQEHGDWYARGVDKQPEFKTALKAHSWKTPYHNGRALMNCVDMLRNSFPLLMVKKR